MLRWINSIWNRLRRRENACVSFDEQVISLRFPDGETQLMPWSELQRVEIVTTDAGPFLEDVFWIFQDGSSEIVVPQESAGFDLLLIHLQRLPGFRNQAVIEAMDSVSNARFLAWQSDPAGSD